MFFSESANVKWRVSPRRGDKIFHRGGGGRSFAKTEFIINKLRSAGGAGLTLNPSHSFRYDSTTMESTLRASPFELTPRAILLKFSPKDL